MESYINSLLKITCVKRNEDFNKFISQNLGSRLGILLNFLELDRKAFNTNNIEAKIGEFLQFRNELFHDRYFSKEIKFQKTKFSKIPFLSNQVDTFQCLLILLEVAQILRYSITGLDIMPNVIIQNQDVSVWEKLDLCYERILKPCFLAALKKHSLGIELDLEIPKGNPFTSNVFQKGELLCLIKADQDVKYFVNVNETPTRICGEIYNNFLKQYNLPSGTMKMPKMIID